MGLIVCARCTASVHYYVMLGNQNAYLWRKRVVMEGNAGKGGGETQICAELGGFRFVNARANRCFTALPCRKLLQTVCIKRQIYPRVMTSQTQFHNGGQATAEVPSLVSYKPDLRSEYHGQLCMRVIQIQRWCYHWDCFVEFLCDVCVSMFWVASYSIALLDKRWSWNGARIHGFKYWCYTYNMCGVHIPNTSNRVKSICLGHNVSFSE